MVSFLCMHFDGSLTRSLSVHLDGKYQFDEDFEWSFEFDLCGLIFELLDDLASGWVDL